ncbi:MAG TPA: type II 3-dehydroquinate dehydratase [Candidatus Limnocylindria bacterium]|nr:type II 3-dehydroquinate dehydratase [Candidatus Limnocylindria bacterium]
MKVLVLHGPNLNLLGEREPETYGRLTLSELDARVIERGTELGVEVLARQSNLEGELVDLIQDARTWAGGILINAGGYSHTSVAIRDAIAAVRLPTIGVHLTNPAAREEFRRTDVVATACRATVAGFGWRSYLLALEGLVALLREDAASR